MVYHCQYTHIYRCPFQQYLKVELDRRLQNDEPYVANVEVLDKAEDPLDGNQRIVIKTTWNNVVPESLQKVADFDLKEIEFEEEFWIDVSQRGYWRRSRNVSLENLLQIWQASTSSIDQNNNDWTFNEEEGSVEVLLKNRLGAALESVLGKFIDNCIKTNINNNEVCLAQFYDR